MVIYPSDVKRVLEGQWTIYKRSTLLILAERKQISALPYSQQGTFIASSQVHTSRETPLHLSEEHESTQSATNLSALTLGLLVYLGAASTCYQKSYLWEFVKEESFPEEPSINAPCVTWEGMIDQWSMSKRELPFRLMNGASMPKS